MAPESSDLLLQGGLLESFIHLVNGIVGNPPVCPKYCLMAGAEGILRKLSLFDEMV